MLANRQWATLYRFDLHPRVVVDYEPASWYASTHPDSFLVKNLIATIPGAGCRYILFNREFCTRWPDGRVETLVLDDEKALAAKLEERFGIAVSRDDVHVLSESLR